MHFDDRRREALRAVLEARSTAVPTTVETSPSPAGEVVPMRRAG